MKIVKTYNWHRRDFHFDALCEHCGNTQTHSDGYDDANYYENVIPNIKCKKCGESSTSKVSDEVVLLNKPRYPQGLVM